MEITVAYEEGRIPVTVFQVEGSLTVDNYERLQQKAESVVKDGTHCILLDMTGVSLLSSAGLRAIHYTFNLLRTDLPTESDKAVQKGMKDGTFKSPHLKIVNPNKHVLSTLEMAGYDMFLDIYFDRQEALASF